MQNDASDQPTGAAATRARILAAAAEVFYEQGIRATSADRIIDMVGITKVTFYRHFRAKSDLVVAYLEQQADAEQAWMRSTRVPEDAAAGLRAVAEGIGAASCRPGFRGCAFINAAAEFPDPDDAVRIAVDRHRGWMLDEFTAIAEDAGVIDSTALARQLMLLRDGAMVNGYLGDAEFLADSLGGAFRSALESARRPGA